MYLKVLVYTKTVDSGFGALWFATQDRDIQGWFNSERRQTRITYEQNGFLVSNTVTEKDFKLINYEDIPNNKKKAMQLGLAVISQVQLCLFNLNLSMKPAKRFLFTNANY